MSISVRDSPMVELEPISIIVLGPPMSSIAGISAFSIDSLQKYSIV